ncbi:MAG TPA: DUF1097 domain-containing protein [Candidatus Paceibacterota bacterium]
MLISDSPRKLRVILMQETNLFINAYLSMQPSFAKFLPVALMIGASAGLVVYLSATLSSSYPWAGAVWLIFISWALYFMAGAKASRMHKYALGLTGGIVAGWLTLAALSYVSSVVGSTWGLPVTVFFIATAIVLLELTDWFELAPAYFFSYAAYFAFVFGGFGGDVSNGTQAISVWAMLMAGLVVGWLTSTIRTAIFNVEQVPLEHRGTVFDRE